MQGLAVVEQAWSTDGVQPSEHFDFWRDVVWEAFVPVTLARGSDGPFPSSCTTRSIGPMTLSMITSSAQSVTRTGAQINRDAGNVYFLNMPLSGGASASQGGRTAVLGGGDFALVDSQEPFELEFSGNFQQISVTLPHDVLACRLPCDQAATGITISGRTGIGAVASAALRALAQTTGSLDRRSARDLTDHLAGLVALSVRSLQAPVVRAKREPLWRRAMEEIDQSLADPDLCTERVARSLNISVRYLHKIFAENGSTFGNSLRDRRLEQARMYLTDEGLAHFTIADIAYRSGFRDSAYFARAFRANYNVSPREYRTCRQRPSGT